ncbi:MAG: hypothetical protein Ct9H300mP31_18730 [Acidimicrobiaceae bacterium]|nr:MAG: hypothetical protein Ct9H300mP31_18730 [Acidimicrobiaceae bacterium]
MGERPDRARLLYLGAEILETAVSEDLLADTTGRFAKSWDEVGAACSATTSRPARGRCAAGARTWTAATTGGPR